MNNIQNNPQRLINIILIISFIEGVFALFIFFHYSSMGKNAVMWGLSFPRLMVAIIVLLILFFLTFLLFAANFKNLLFGELFSRINNWLSAGQNLFFFSINMFFLFLSILGLLTIFPRLQLFFSSLLSPSFDHFISTINAIIHIARPILIWILFLLAQSLLALFFLFPDQLLARNYYSFHSIWKTIILWLFFLTAAAHWTILYFQLYVFNAIPNWFWKFYIKPISHPEFFIVLFVTAITLVSFILQHPERTKLNLLLIFFCGYGLLVGFGFIEKDGFETIRQLFIQKGHWGYAKFACTQPGLLDTLLNYEQVALLDPFFKTKPPGIFAFYITIENMINSICPATTIEGRYYILTTFMAYAFPLLAFSIIFILFQFSKKIKDIHFASLPCLLYLFFPNVILTPLFLDQELYPLLFMAGLLLCLQTIQKQSYQWAFIAGLFCYTAIYFSFSLLPLIPLLMIWLGIDYFINQNTRSFKKLLLLVSGFSLGLIFQYFLFRLLLNYDIFIRYANAMASHRTHKEFLPDIHGILNAIHVNNAEFLSWIGFPIVILLLSRLFRTLSRLFTKNLSLIDGLFLSTCLVYIMLNISGQTHGEVARLWIFLVPLVSFFSSLELNTIFPKNKLAILYVISLQLITMFTIFRFQDLD